MTEGDIGMIKYLGSETGYGSCSAVENDKEDELTILLCKRRDVVRFEKGTEQEEGGKQRKRTYEV